MIDVVYILGTGSQWDDNELRLSLRSLERHGRNAGDVYVIGHCPEWVTGVKHVPCGDPYDRKCDNLWYKLQQYKGDRCVLMNDDFFLLQQVELEDIPNYYDGQMEGLAIRLTNKYRRLTPYAYTIEATEALLLRNNRPTRNYAVHVPMVVDMSIARKLFQALGDAPGMSFRCLYGNYVNRNCAELADLKFIEPVNVSKAIEGKTFFSIGDGFLDEAGKAFLFELYNEKSRFEK